MKLGPFNLQLTILLKGQSNEKLYKGVSFTLPFSLLQQVIIYIFCLAGVKYGVRRLSEFCFTCGLVLMCCILLLDKVLQHQTKLDRHFV